MIIKAIKVNKNEISGFFNAIFCLNIQIRHVIIFRLLKTTGTMGSKVTTTTSLSYFCT